MPLTYTLILLSRYEQENVIATKRSGRITAGLFGWMCAAGVGELTDVGEGRFTSDKYVEILDEVLLPSVQALLFPGRTPFSLLQDNSPIHTGRVVRTWFEEHPQITVLPHPPRSPDLNPIEHIWAAMTRLCGEHDGRRARGTVVRSALRAWEDLRRPEGQCLAESLVMSMRTRLNDVLAAGGGYTKY